MQKSEGVRLEGFQHFWQAAVTGEKQSMENPEKSENCEKVCPLVNIGRESRLKKSSFASSVGSVKL